MRTSADEREYHNFGHEAAAHDLARANDQIDEFFIQTNSIREFLQRTPNKPFIAGPKGSGKSLLLFKRLLTARAQSGALVLPHSPEKAFSPPLSFSTTPFWHLSPNGKPAFAAWGSLWAWALFRSILSGWLGHENATNGQRSARAIRISHLSDGGELVDPFDLVSRYLNELDDGRHVRRGRAILPDASALRTFVREHGAEFPPTYLFIDNHDDAFEEQPEYWIACAYGAFLAIQELHYLTNRRIHCFMTLRPEVVWKLQESEHYPKWSHDILRIAWEDHELMELFRNRAAHIHHSLLARPNLASSAPLHALFGDEMFERESGTLCVRNVSIESKQPLFEPIDSYLLRHTLRRPRDLIIIGNQILDKMGVNGSPERSRSEQTREGVAAASQIIRDGYLAECAARWPWQRADASLKAFLKRYIRYNIIAYAEAMRIEREFADQLGVAPETVHPLNELVALGLLGYPVPDTNRRHQVQRFLRPSESMPTSIPRSADWYLVHPILYSEPFHIQPVHGQPVGPGLPFDHSKLKWDQLGGNGRRRSLRPTDHVAVLSWIHVSDLHFGAGNIAHRFDQKAVTAAILRDVRQIRESRGAKPDFVFVTGDVAFSAKASQYKDATGWLEQLAEAAGVERSSVRVVPGNHDVDRAAAAKVMIADMHKGIRAMPSGLDERLQDEEAREALSQKLKSYAAFSKRFLPKNQRGRVPALDWVERRQVGTLGYPVRIVGLSSVWCSDASDGRENSQKSEPFVPNMVLGQGQILEKLGDATDDELVFVLTHHPPEWYHPSSADALVRALSRLSHLHLCGHVHNAGAVATRRFGGNGRSVRYVAGAAHGDPSERDHGYAWGAVRWNSDQSKWEAGWAPRIYRPDPEGMYALPYPLDVDGYAWQDLDLRWREPTVEV